MSVLRPLKPWSSFLVVAMLGLGSAAVGCARADGAPNDDDPNDDVEDVEQTSSALISAKAVLQYNHPTTHNATWIRLAKGGRRDVYDRDGHVLYAGKLHAFADTHGHHGVRIQRNAYRRIDGVRYFFMWGTDPEETPSGFVSEKELDSDDVSSELARADFEADGNGEQAPTDAVVTIEIAKMDPDLRYCRLVPKTTTKAKTDHGPHDPNELNNAQDFADYAQPGRNAVPQNLDYTYLSWNLVNVSGGGLNRATIANGEDFRIGKLDGKDMVVRLPVVDAGKSSVGKCHYTPKKKKNGKVVLRLDGYRADGASKSEYEPIDEAYVKFAYGSVGEGSQRIFGWALIEHKSKGVIVPHVTCKRGACSFLGEKKSKLVQAVVANGNGNGGAANVCEGKADGTYCHEVAKSLGYVCKGGEVAQGLSCPPPFTVCQHPSADGASLVCGY